jgi:hypothetical protein
MGMGEDYGGPGLRERVIAIICDEWPNAHGSLEATTIYERLVEQGSTDSKRAVREVLGHLSQSHPDHIDFVISTTDPEHPDELGRMSIRLKDTELCP